MKSNSSQNERVPEELIQNLHEANKGFHDARTHLEEALDGTEPRHQERVDDAGEKFNRAEQTVEDADAKIRAAIDEQKGR